MPSCVTINKTWLDLHFLSFRVLNFNVTEKPRSTDARVVMPNLHLLQLPQMHGSEGENVLLVG